MTVLRWICWALFRLALAARYRLRVRAREQLRTLKGPVLILPNHPGYIDPFLLFAVLWPDLRMRPLMLVTSTQRSAIWPMCRSAATSSIRCSITCVEMTMWKRSGRLFRWMSSCTSRACGTRSFAS